ncbi:MAG: hypothetical protein ABII64_05460 [Elusimicrobiota bacterium]
MFCRKLLIMFLTAIVPVAPLRAIGVDPTRYIFKAEHGKECNGKFLVTNDHDCEMQVDIEISRGIESGENKDLLKDTGWLNIKEKSFVLQPKEGRTVNFSVNVPDGTAGTFSAKISFIDRSNEAFSSSVTIPVYVVIKGTERVEWDMDSFEINETPAGLSGGLRLKNKGNVHFYANGTIIICDRGGNECYRSSVGGGRAVFPSTVTLLPLDVSKLSLKNGRYDAEIEIKGYGEQPRSFKYNLEKKGSKYIIRRL